MKIDGGRIDGRYMGEGRRNRWVGQRRSEGKLVEEGWEGWKIGRRGER